MFRRGRKSLSRSYTPTIYEPSVSKPLLNSAFADRSSINLTMSEARQSKLQENVLLHSWTHSPSLDFYHMNFFRQLPSQMPLSDLSTIDEYNSNGNPSQLMWSCLTSHLCHISFPSLNNRWTQVYWKSFSVDVMLFDVTSLPSLLSISRQ